MAPPLPPDQQAAEENRQPRQGAQDKGRVEPLHHREGEQVPQSRVTVLEALGDSADRVGRRRAADARPVQGEQGQYAQKPDMYPQMPLEKCPHGLSSYSAVTS